MENGEHTSMLRAVAELDDQWLQHAERSAFIGEAYSRLLTDHPHLPAEVIQGGEHEIRQLRLQCQQIGKQIVKVKRLIQNATDSRDPPKERG